jgi:8-oxo-dGTP pyrophosphatase MutT (NUDIX family)
MVHLAAQREIKEETGLDILPYKDVFTTSDVIVHDNKDAVLW